MNDVFIVLGELNMYYILRLMSVGYTYPCRDVPICPHVCPYVPYAHKCIPMYTHVPKCICVSTLCPRVYIHVLDFGLQNLYFISNIPKENTYN